MEIRLHITHSFALHKTQGYFQIIISKVIEKKPKKIPNEREIQVKIIR